MFLGFLADHTGDCDSGCRRFESGRSPHFFRLKQPSDISCLTFCAKIVQIIVAPIGQSGVKYLVAGDRFAGDSKIQTGATYGRSNIHHQPIR